MMDFRAMSRAVEKITADLGKDILRDRKAFSAALDDALPGWERQAERTRLTEVVSLGIGRNLLEAHTSESVRGSVFERQVEILAETGLTRETAEEVVAVFTGALGWNTVPKTVTVRTRTQNTVDTLPDSGSNPPSQPQSGPSASPLTGAFSFLTKAALLLIALAFIRLALLGYFKSSDSADPAPLPASPSPSASAAAEPYSPPAVSVPDALPETFSADPGRSAEPVNPAPAEAPAYSDQGGRTSSGRRSEITLDADGTCIIPENIVDLEPAYFKGDFNIRRIEFEGRRIRKLPPHIFEGCSSLESVKLPDSITEICSGAFYDCTSLQEAVIPDSVSVIGVQAFWNCRSLRHIDIPDSVRVIGGEAFSGCSSLQALRIPAQVTTIGLNAFAGVEDVSYSGDAPGYPWGAGEQTGTGGGYVNPYSSPVNGWDPSGGW